MSESALCASVLTSVPDMPGQLEHRFPRLQIAITCLRVREAVRCHCLQDTAMQERAMTVPDIVVLVNQGSIQPNGCTTDTPDASYQPADDAAVKVRLGQAMQCLFLEILCSSSEFLVSSIRCDVKG
jgi:hypothetical protein